jgi:superfamily II DNA or RNA helicase
MNANELKSGIIVRGPVLPEPIEVLIVTPLGDVIKIVGAGQKTGQVHQRVLRLDQLQFLDATPEREPFDGDPARFRLGVEAARLGLAYEYDPYFSLSISRVDPLPHQLEAVYDYFMRLPRIRFLLADDPGAGKTIMAGLLLKELKIRGLVKRTLIVAPANLCFQWQRELKEKFRESFEVIRSDVLRANYGQNPWQEKNQVITSISWVSRIEDAKESLLRSRWDLVIVDEAHKMAAYSADKKTLAYKLGEALSTMTDHYLLMTATPHKGDPENFCLFLELLDRDIYGSVKSLEEAMRRHHAPFYLRRTKEALVAFPDSETGEVKKLFTKREVRTASFELDGDEYDFYDALTRYVEDQSIKASEDDSARGRALSFTMAMLQRRFASSVYAVRRSLERMRDKRQKILTDPEKYRKEQIEDRLPDDFDDLPEDEQMEIEARLEGLVASVDPIALREEIQRLGKLVEHARSLEGREIESKLVKLRKVLSDNNVFNDPKMKLLIFTEHKDTLDYLAGDGKDGRLLGKLRQWNLKTTQIHGDFAAIPYGDLSEFFYVWLRPALGGKDPALFGTPLIERNSELIVTNAQRGPEGQAKDTVFFSTEMSLALKQCRRIVEPKGIGCIVFADASTDSWEAMLGAVLSAGWIVTASWPLDTEMVNRTRARKSASLQSSIHIVCRPRETSDSTMRSDSIGDWRDVLAELPKRIHEWMPRLAAEGVVGADAIFACLGPALEVFSRYSHEVVLLKEYLEHIWAAVSKEALAMIFTGADATGFEEDARITAMWLWTLSTAASNSKGANTAEDRDGLARSGARTPIRPASGIALGVSGARCCGLRDRRRSAMAFSRRHLRAGEQPR